MADSHIKIDIFRRKSAAKFLCVKTVNGKVVKHSLAYLAVHKWFVGDVPLNVNFVCKDTHRCSSSECHRWRHRAVRLTLLVTADMRYVTLWTWPSTVWPSTVVIYWTSRHQNFTKFYPLDPLNSLNEFGSLAVVKQAIVGLRRRHTAKMVITVCGFPFAIREKLEVSAHYITATGCQWLICLSNRNASSLYMQLYLVWPVRAYINATAVLVVLFWFIRCHAEILVLGVGHRTRRRHTHRRHKTLQLEP